MIGYWFDSNSGLWKFNKHWQQVVIKDKTKNVVQGFSYNLGSLYKNVSQGYNYNIYSTYINISQGNNYIERSNINGAK